MLRLRRLALGSAGATVVLVFVASLDFGVRAPAPHVALETTATITASAAALLLLGRFWRTGYLDELILSVGLSLLALSNLVFNALPAVFHLESGRVSTWGTLFTGMYAALLICVAALLPRRKLRTGRRWPLVDQVRDAGPQRTADRLGQPAHERIAAGHGGNPATVDRGAPRIGASGRGIAVRA